MATESSTHRRVVELVNEALEFETSARKAFLDQACGGDSRLRAEVESLLEEAAGLEGGFLEVPAARWAADLLASEGAAACSEPEDEGELNQPSFVGPYRVLRELGRGGMGTVYLAEQRDPIERQVALKVIRGFDDGRGGRRFADECRALARLKHPNIAAVYDAGVTDAGRAFVAMEWVEGPHITDWCDQNRLSIRERVELFMSVCAGVSHAHQKGLVHRDLKPSNVLVASVDGNATAKVIDFGIARTLDEVDASGPAATFGSPRSSSGEPSLLMGSPLYMSPEAIDTLDRTELDTRTDVYSLGVLLYELLVGVPPHDGSGLSLGALLRLSRDTEPPTASKRWAALSDSQKQDVAGLRGVCARALGRRLQGDLDAILAKATARERDSRYGTVSDLVSDLRRYLESYPVAARTPFLGYRLSRFGRRHARVIVAVAVVIGVLVAGIVARTQEARRANLEAERARQALAVAEQVSDFLIGLFEVVDPDRGSDDPQSVDELLARAEATMAEELADQPLARARFMQTIGRVAMNRMELGRAATLFEDALALREAHSSPTNPETITNIGSLGVIYRRQGRLDEAETMLTRAVELSEASAVRDPARLSATITWLANLHYSQDRYEQAIIGHQRALAIRRSELPDELGAIAESLNNLGVALRDVGRYLEARPAILEAERLFAREFGAQHPWVVGCWLNLARIEEQLGSWDEAERLLVRAGDTWNEIHGEAHHRTLLARRALGALWRRWHRTEEAVLHLTDLLAMQEAQDESDPLEIARTLIELGRTQLLQFDLSDAESTLERARRIYAATYGEEHNFTTRVSAFLAQVEWKRGALEEAAESFRVFAARTVEQRGERHPLSGWMYQQLGILRSELQQYPKAEAALLRAKEIFEANESRSLRTARTCFHLGRLRVRQGRVEEGAALIVEALELFEKLLPAGHPELADARAELSV